MGCGASSDRTTSEAVIDPSAYKSESIRDETSAAPPLAAGGSDERESNPVDAPQSMGGHLQAASGGKREAAAGGLRAVLLSELVCGLEHAIALQLLEGVAEGLGVDATKDEDVVARLVQLPDGGSGMFDTFCLPRIRDVMKKMFWAISEDEVQTVQDANSRYAEDPTSYSASFGLEEHFYQGLDEYNGRPDGSNIEAQMLREFRSRESFVTRNYGGVRTDLATEWEFVLAPLEGKVYPGENGLARHDGKGFYPGRERRSMSEFMKLELTKKAGLVRSEVIAVRLYTGPAYMQLNLGLRMGGRKAVENGVDNFPATCSALNSAIKKLARQTPLPGKRKLYRGLSGMALPQDVLEAKRFAEFAFSSATPNKDVALSYAGTDRASLFEIEVGEIDRGADISSYSQYPQEEEHVIPPLSHFEIVQVRRHGNINCYVLKLNVNLRALTIEELRASRKHVVKRLGLRLKSEVDELTGMPSDKLEEMFRSHIEPIGPEWFNNPGNFKEIVCKLVDAFSAEVERARKQENNRELLRKERSLYVDGLAALQDSPSSVILGKRIRLGGTFAGDAEDKEHNVVQLSELVGGLEHAIALQLLEGVAEGLGVDATKDEDVVARLVQLPDGGSGMFDTFCLPRIRDVMKKMFWAISEDEVQTVQDANSRYAEDPTSYSASFGLEEHFYQGLDEYNGRPDGSNIEAQMLREFRSRESFVTRNYGGVRTDLATEWEFVLAPLEGKVYPGENGLARHDGKGFYPGRERRSMSEFMKLELTKKAGLVRSEVIAVRLYTGPAYMQLNLGLRMGGRKAVENGVDNFPATCSALNSAIKKLARQTPLPGKRKLYRGLSGMALPQDVLEAKRFAEFAFSSATPNKDVALSYAGTDRASLFEIEVGEIDRGADISSYSQYPQEEEHVIPPLSHFEIVQVRRHGNINCYVLKLNVNLRALTIEELRASRKHVVKRLGLRLKSEVDELTGMPSDKLEEMFRSHIEPIGPEWFNNPGNFKEIVCKLVDAFVLELHDAADKKCKASKDPTATPGARFLLLYQAVQLLDWSTPGDWARIAPVQEEMLGVDLTDDTTQELATKLSEMAFQFGRHLYSKQHLTQAYEVLQRALAIRNKLHANQPGGHPEIADVLYEIGKTLQAFQTAEKLRESLDVFSQALAVRKTHLGESHRDVGLIFSSLGQVKTDLKQYDQALEYFGKARDLQLGLFDEVGLPGSPNDRATGAYLVKNLSSLGRIDGVALQDLSDTYVNMAQVHQELGHHEHALAMYSHSLKITINVLGSTNEMVAVAYNNMADVYKSLQQPDKALEALNNAKEITVARLGEHHGDLATIYNGIGCTYMDLGEQAEALSYLKKSVAIDVECLGEQHPDVALSKHNLALCLFNLDRKAEAKQHFLACADIYQKANGDDDEDAMEELAWAKHCD